MSPELDCVRALDSPRAGTRDTVKRERAAGTTGGRPRSTSRHGEGQERDADDNRPGRDEQQAGTNDSHHCHSLNKSPGSVTTVVRSSPLERSPDATHHPSNPASAGAVRLAGPGLPPGGSGAQTAALDGRVAALAEASRAGSRRFAPPLPGCRAVEPGFGNGPIAVQVQHGTRREINLFVMTGNERRTESTEGWQSCQAENAAMGVTTSRRVSSNQQME